MMEKQSNNTLNRTSAISIGAVVNELNFHQRRLTTSIVKLKLAGPRILLLAVQNEPLVVICALFTGCLPADSINLMFDNYR